MKRIAGELGVSITTVSKVLNNRADISEATRSRVLAKVEELGYQRNAVARSLSLRRTHTLGIVIPDLMHSFFVEIIAGIEPVASVRGYGLLLCSSGEDPGKERAELEMLRGRQVDGVVLASAHGSGNTDMLQQLTKRGTTLVMIDRDDHPTVKCHRVLTDDERVGAAGHRAPARPGRRAIAHIAGPPIAHAKRRERGWRDALRARGIKAPDDWLVPRRLHGERRLSRDEAAADRQAADRRGVRGERSSRDRRDESDLGSGAAGAGRHRGRRRRRHRARGSAARAAHDGRLVAPGAGKARGGTAAQRPRSRATIRRSAS